MERWIAGALLLLLSACSGARTEWKLPAELEGGWKLSVLPPSRETFEMVGTLKPRTSQMAGYVDAQGGKVHVAGLELANGSVAFEQVQKWRVQPGRIAFHHGPWLVIVEAAGMDAGQLSSVANAVEKTMPN